MATFTRAVQSFDILSRLVALCGQLVDEKDSLRYADLKAALKEAAANVVKVVR